MLNTVKHCVPLFWCLSNNFGDSLNHWLVSKISQKPIVYVDISSPHIKHVSIGSILNWCDGSCVVWGAGLANKSDVMNRESMPRICAVRGPLSRDRVLQLGLECPDKMGDPALLLPEFYTPVEKERSSLGILPHYVHQLEVYSSSLSRLPGVKVIDVLAPVEQVIDDICSCDAIISSSLHGLIVADTYGVPNRRFKGSTSLNGDGMKFTDYYTSVKLPIMRPLFFNSLASRSSLLSITKHATKNNLQMDDIHVWEACPFKTE
jgi:pyruvyltransferase